MTGSRQACGRKRHPKWTLVTAEAGSGGKEDVLDRSNSKGNKDPKVCGSVRVTMGQRGGRGRGWQKSWRYNPGCWGTGPPGQWLEGGFQITPGNANRKT